MKKFFASFDDVSKYALGIWSKKFPEVRSDRDAVPEPDIAATEIIDLRRIPTFVVGPTTDKVRTRHMQELCRRLELSAEFSGGIVCDPPSIGCNIAHLRAYFRARTRVPFLVLENDCAVNDSFDPEVPVPAGADMIYLGGSSCGCVADLGNRGLEGALVVTHHSSRLVRLHNMTGAHAILFTSTRAVNAAIDVAVDYTVNRVMPHDIGLALMQSRHAVYGLRRPLFYQSGALQNPDAADSMERMTRIELCTPVLGRTTLKPPIWNDRPDFLSLETGDDGIPQWRRKRQV